MRVVFFEVETWENEDLRKNFPYAVLSSDKLSVQTAPSYIDAEVISCFIYSQITKGVVDQMPQLKLIATRSTGYDHIDINYCKGKNVAIANVPEYGSATVAEHTFALILSLTRKIYQSVNQAKNLNFNHQEIRGTDLCEKTIGIVGLGKIGRNVLRISSGFGMKALVFNRTQDPALLKQYNFKYTSLVYLLANSDIVSLHLPLNEKTKHIINKENIMKFKKGSYLINTARGALIDTEAILEGLNNNILAGVGLDVMEEEKELGEEAAILTEEFRKNIDLKTLVLDHMLINHPKVLITPHNAFNSIEALRRITDTTIKNIKSFLDSSPINII